MESLSHKSGSEGNGGVYRFLPNSWDDGWRQLGQKWQATSSTANMLAAAGPV